VSPAPDGPTVVVAGEALIDLVPQPTPDHEVVDGGPARPAALRPVPAGSPVNVAVGLGRLGIRCAYCGTLSTDGFGRALQDRLADAAVDLGLSSTTQRPTTLAVVHLDAAGRAEYGFYLDATSAATFGDTALPALPDDAALHVSFGAIGPTHRPAGDALVELMRREAGRRVVSLDPNVRPSAIVDRAGSVARYEQAVAASDVVKVSDEDLELLHPGEDPDVVAARWADAGPALVVVTRGPAGAVAFGPAGHLEVPGIEVAVADTVGAGDAFTSGLLASLAGQGLLERAALRRADAVSLRRALGQAVRVAAITCTREGADPPTAAELDALG
jgi:fructokinase